MPFVQRTKYFDVEPGEIFYTCKKYLKGKRKFLNYCNFVKTVCVMNAAFKELNALYPGFTLTLLDCWKVEKPILIYHWQEDDLKLFTNTKFQHYGEPEFNDNDSKYSPWLWSGWSIYYTPTVKILPETLDEAEKIFDKNVLPIKKLVKDIGGIKKLIHKEQKIFYLYDDSNIIDYIFFTELNKRFQCYGLISVEFNKNNNELINSKNMLKFNIKHNIKQERTTLQLENILNPKKSETVDSIVHSFSILTTKKQGTIGANRKMQKRIIDEFRIEGLQSFNQYAKPNPISIAITESEIQSKHHFV